MGFIKKLFSFNNSIPNAYEVRRIRRKALDKTQRELDKRDKKLEKEALAKLGKEISEKIIHAANNGLYKIEVNELPWAMESYLRKQGYEVMTEYEKLIGDIKALGFEVQQNNWGQRLTISQQLNCGAKFEFVADLKNRAHTNQIPQTFEMHREETVDNICALIRQFYPNAGFSNGHLSFDKPSYMLKFNVWSQGLLSFKKVKIISVSLSSRFVRYTEKEEIGWWPLYSNDIVRCESNAVVIYPCCVGGISYFYIIAPTVCAIKDHLNRFHRKIKETCKMDKNLSFYKVFKSVLRKVMEMIDKGCIGID